jgi:hypothetical protein
MASVIKEADVIRCMIDNEQNALCEDTGMEQMACKIDIIMILRSI